MLLLFFASCGSIITPLENPPEYEFPTYWLKGDPPGQLRLITGKRKAGGYFGEGGGLLPVDIRTLRSRSLDWKLMCWESIAKYEVKEEEEFFLVSYVADAVIAAKWEMKWVHTVTDGTPENPQRIVIQFQKVTGTGFIKHWKGSFVLTRVSPGFTAFSMRTELNAMMQGASACRQSVEMFHRRFMTGRP